MFPSQRRTPLRWRPRFLTGRMHNYARNSRRNRGGVFPRRCHEALCDGGAQGMQPRREGLRAAGEISGFLPLRIPSRHTAVQEHRFQVPFRHRKAASHDLCVHEEARGESGNRPPSSDRRDAEEQRLHNQHPFGLLIQVQTEEQERHLRTLCLQSGEGRAGLLALLSRRHAGCHGILRFHQQMRDFRRNHRGRQGLPGIRHRGPPKGKRQPPLPFPAEEKFPHDQRPCHAFFRRRSRGQKGEHPV